jgi:CDP-6-deoxy-D-xylo-4-hexulose-3-dehydrase
MSWPLMRNNIAREDLDAVIRFLRADDPMLTAGKQVALFEQEWSAWLGVRHSVFVNSGSSANLITMAALRHRFGPGEVIVPTLTWVSDITAVLHAGLTPVFVDIDPRTLGMDNDAVMAKLSPRTRAVFITHVLGYDALTDRLLDALQERHVPLVEDVCESHGATHDGRKLGTFGLASNFSFYYAHHMSTVEGGMVCTDDPELYATIRMLRAHGLVREAGDDAVKRQYADAHPDLTPDFIFALPGFNVRSTEINAVMGRSQLRRLDASNEKRRSNLAAFLRHLDPKKYFTEFATDGSCNYAFTLVLRRPDDVLRDRVVAALRDRGVEFRRGTSGGGNQLRQPYLRGIVDPAELARFPRVDHVHFYGFYIGNYPDLEPGRIVELCDMLNSLESGS